VGLEFLFNIIGETYMKKLIYIFITIMVYLPSLSPADVGGGGRTLEDGMFWGADLDRNERLDKEEAKAVHNLADETIFAEYDQDKNGSINRVEFYHFMQRAPWTDIDK